VEEIDDGKVLVHFQDLTFTSQLHLEEFEDNLPEKITKKLEEMLLESVSSESESK